MRANRGIGRGGDRARTAPVFDPATGEVTGTVVLASAQDVDHARRSVTGRLRTMAGHLAHRPDEDPLRLPPAGRPPPRRPGPPDHRRARQGAGGRPGGGGPRHRGDRVRLWHPPPAQGRVLRGRLQRGRRLFGPTAARRGGGRHAVQLPGDGPHVDVPGGHRLRQHVHPQALGAGPVAVVAHRRPVAGGRSARRRLHRGPRRLRRRGRAARPPGCGRGVLRGLHAGGPPRVRAGHGGRQALPGARGREEPRRGAPRRRPPRHRRHPHRGRLRVGRRALHGHLGGGGGRGRRPSGPGPVGACRGTGHRTGPRPGLGHGAADHRGPP